jgi:hypothetical protein
MAGDYKYQQEVVVKSGTKFEIEKIEKVIVRPPDMNSYEVTLVHLKEIR